MDPHQTWSVRRCTISDTDIVLQLAQHTFVEAYWDRNEPENMRAYMAEHFTPERVAAELENPHSVFYLLLQDDQTPAGYLKVNFAGAQTELNKEKTLEIERIYLKKAFWGAGIGDVLLNKAIEIAQETQVDYVWLGVWKDNERALRFYQKHGFEIFGTHTFVLGAEAQEDWLMRRRMP
jgi:diamine N-acetyltransferase